jgi:hypothetical protein
MGFHPVRFPSAIGIEGLCNRRPLPRLFELRQDRAGWFSADQRSIATTNPGRTARCINCQGDET